MRQRSIATEGSRCYCRHLAGKKCHDRGILGGLKAPLLSETSLFTRKGLSSMQLLLNLLISIFIHLFFLFVIAKGLTGDFKLHPK